MFLGGGQERGLRSGTVPTPLTVGMGAACAIAKAEMDNDKAHVTRLADKLVQVSARFLGIFRSSSQNRNLNEK